MILQHACILTMLLTVVASYINSVSPSEVSLGGIIEVTIEGLGQKVAQDKIDPKNIRLYLNDRPLQSLKPETVDLKAGTVRFHSSDWMLIKMCGPVCSGHHR
jgi:hypothetical protein